ncbi:hypothetical protein [Azospirillum largimobile]
MGVKTAEICESVPAVQEACAVQPREVCGGVSRLGVGGVGLRGPHPDPPPLGRGGDWSFAGVRR